MEKQDQDHDNIKDNLKAALNSSITTDGIEYQNKTSDPRKINVGQKKKVGRPRGSTKTQSHSHPQKLPKLPNTPGLHKDFKAALTNELDDVTHDELFRKLERYYQFFPDIPMKPIHANASKTELMQELDRVKSYRRRGQALANIKRLDLLLTYGLELALSFLGYNHLSGITVIAQQSQDIIDEVFQELAIEYEDYLTGGPWMLYLMHFGQRITMAIAANSNVGGVSGESMYSKQPVSSDRPYTKTYADL
jgi:hypothetical protein